MKKRTFVLILAEAECRPDIEILLQARDAARPAAARGFAGERAAVT
jgi:hypothetical protein